MTTAPKILVIDDEIQIRRLLQLTLEPNGYQLKFAETGSDGIVCGNWRRTGYCGVPGSVPRSNPA